MCYYLTATLLSNESRIYQHVRAASWLCVAMLLAKHSANKHVGKAASRRPSSFGSDGSCGLDSRWSAASGCPCDANQSNPAVCSRCIECRASWCVAPVGSWGDPGRQWPEPLSAPSFVIMHTMNSKFNLMISNSIVQSGLRARWAPGGGVQCDGSPARVTLLSAAGSSHSKQEIIR